jgi:hypothetical protein
MATNTAITPDYEITCLMCSSPVGWLIGGALYSQSGQASPVPRRRGLFRCPRCGGSAYLEPLSKNELRPASLLPAAANRARRSA